MASNWDDVFKEYVNATEEELVKVGRLSIKEIFAYLPNDWKDEAKRNFVVLTTKVFVGSDKKVSSKEFEFFKLVFTDIPDYGYDEFFKDMQKGYTPAFVEEFVSLCSINPSLKDPVIKYGLAICAVDENFSVDEQRLIKRIYNA